MTRVLWVALALGVLPGCGTTGKCAVPETLTVADGGTARCLAPVDCPRQSNVLVCASTGDRLHDCVDCVDTNCIRFRPGPCP